MPTQYCVCEYVCMKMFIQQTEIKAFVNRLFTKRRIKSIRRVVLSSTLAIGVASYTNNSFVASDSTRCNIERNTFSDSIIAKEAKEKSECVYVDSECARQCSCVSCTIHAISSMHMRNVSLCDVLCVNIIVYRSNISSSKYTALIAKHESACSA